MLSSKNPVQRVATRRAFRAAQQQPKTKFSQEEQEEMRRKTRAYSEKYRADRMAGKKIAYEDSSIMSDASTASITTGQRSTASSDTSKTFCNSPDPDLVVTEALQNLPRRLAGRDILKGLATELRRPLQQLSPKPSATPTMNVQSPMGPLDTSTPRPGSGRRVSTRKSVFSNTCMVAREGPLNSTGIGSSIKPCARPCFDVTITTLPSDDSKPESLPSSSEKAKEGESETPNCQNHPTLESDARSEGIGKENREQLRRQTLRERSRAERRSIPIINGIVPLEELAPAVPEEEPAERVEKTFIVQVIPEDEEVEHVVQERTMGIRDATAGRSLHLSPNVTPSHYRNSEPSSMSPEMHVTPVEKTPQLPGRYGSKSHPLPSCIPANATVDVMPSIIKKAKEPRSTSINRLSQGVDTSRLQAIISSIVQREVQKFANVRSSMAEPSAAASSTKRSMDSRGSREESPGKDRSQSSPKRFKPSQSVHQMAACEEADDEQSSDEDSPLEQPSIPVKSSGCSESSHSMSLRTQRKSSNTSAAADVSLEVLEKSSKKQATLMESSTRQQEKNLSAAKQISIDWEESFESEDLHNKSSRVAGKSIVEKRRSSKTSILNSNPRVGSRASLRNRGDIHEHGTTTGNIQTSQESTKTSLTVSSFAISLETSELPTIENQSEDSTIVQESANDTNGHETTENEVTDNATLRERTDDATVRDTTDSIDTEETENETDACQMTNGTDLRSIDGTMRSGSRSLRSLQAVDYTGMLSFSEMEKDKAERRPNVRQMSQSSKLGSTLSSTVSFRKGKKAQEHQTVGKKGRRKEASLSQAQSSEERTLPEEDTRPPSEASGSTFYSPESGDDSDLDQVTITNRYSASLTSHTSESQMDVECQTTANEEGERAASPPPLENPLEKISFPERARSPSEESGSTFYSPESGDESDLDEVPVTNHYSVSHTTESHIDAQDGTETGTSEESAHQDNSPSNCARASSLVDDDDEDEDEAYQPGEGTLTEEGTSSGFHESEDGEGVEDSLATSISKRQGQSNGNSNSEEIDLSEYPEAVQACFRREGRFQRLKVDHERLYRLGYRADIHFDGKKSCLTMTKLHRSQRLQEFIDFDRDNLYYHSMKYMREERKKRRGVKRNQGQKETQVERRKGKKKPRQTETSDTMGQDEGVSHETRGHRYVIEYPSSQEREDPTTEPDPESGSHVLGRDHLRTVGPDRGEPKQGDPYVMNYFRPSHGMVFSHFFISPGCSKPPRPIRSGNTVVAFVEVGVVQLTMGTSVPRTLHPSDVVILKPRIEYSLKNVGQSQAVLLMATMDYREMMKSFMREVGSRGIQEILEEVSNEK